MMNSNELLDYALRELQVAANTNKKSIEIILLQDFNGDIKELCDTLKIKEITEKLRAEFNDYTIKSRVVRRNFSALITYVNGPCDLLYQVVWVLTLQK